MATFSAQINAWIEKTKGDADKVVRFALNTLDGKIDFRSPVGDAKYWVHKAPPGYAGGAFRRNWQLSMDAPKTGVLGGVDPDGTITKGEHAAVLAAAKAGSIYYLTNNLPYAKRIEEGWSRQAPVGLVALTVVEWNNIVENAVNGVKAGGGDMSAGFEAYPL